MKCHRKYIHWSRAAAASGREPWANDPECPDERRRRALQDTAAEAQWATASPRDTSTEDPPSKLHIQHYSHLWPSSRVDTPVTRPCMPPAWQHTFGGISWKPFMSSPAGHKNTALKVIPLWYFFGKHCFDSNTVLVLLSKAVFWETSSI